MIKYWLIIKIVFILSLKILIIKAQSRCEYLCQNDDDCRKGQCVLVYCVDSPACYRYCFECYDQRLCQQSGPNCDSLNQRVESFSSSLLLKSKSSQILFNLKLIALIFIFNSYIS